MLDAVDLDDDGLVTPRDLTRSFFSAPYLDPDVDLTAHWDGEPVLWPRHDGDADHVSFAVGFHAVPVTLVR